MRVILVLVIFAASLRAQTQTQTEITKLNQELRTALHRDDLVTSAELADKLDAKVRGARNAWLTRDSNSRANEVLTWLPPDIESFWVNQHPFVIKADSPLSITQETPVVSYCIDRLASVTNGKFYRALSNRTIRMVMAATRGLTYHPGSMIPGAMREQDVAYFYFTADPIDFGPPDESIENQPIWQGAAPVVDQTVPFRRGVEQPRRDDPHWIALARPDLLILSNKRELLIEILGRVAHGSPTRALPPSLPEWAEVDRGASFWGVRHYTQQSKPKAGEYGFKNASLPNPDGAAIGATVKFDTRSEQLEVNYLSPAPIAEARGGAGDNVGREFKVDQPHPGVTRVTSSIRERGPFPMHIAFIMLGFGMYQ
jgi:hypothetical protein